MKHQPPLQLLILTSLLGAAGVVAQADDGDQAKTRRRY